MSYEYQNEKAWLFTEDGQVKFLAVRDKARSLLKEAGAFSMSAIISAVNAGDTWKTMACVDRLVELREIREVPRGDACPGQGRIFVEQGK